MASRSFVCGLVVAVVCVVAMFGVSDAVAAKGASAQQKESAAMSTFRRSLNAADQALLTKMKSKSRYIEALLGSKKVMDKRDQIEEPVQVESRGTQQCCNCNAGSAGCYHPTDVKRSHIIRCCIPVAAASPVKRGEVNSKDAQKVLKSLSKADQELMQKHKSKIGNLVAAAALPVGTEEKRSEVAKKEQKDAAVPADLIQKLREGLTDLELKLDELSGPRAEQTSDAVLEEMSKKFVSDVNTAKAKGIKLNDLLAALKKRGFKP